MLIYTEITIISPIFTYFELIREGYSNVEIYSLRDTESCRRSFMSPLTVIQDDINLSRQLNFVLLKDFSEKAVLDCHRTALFILSRINLYYKKIYLIYSSYSILSIFKFHLVWPSVETDGCYFSYSNFTYLKPNIYLLGCACVWIKLFT